MEPFLFLFRMDPLRLWYANLGGLHPDTELQMREHPFGWERIVLLGSCHGVLCAANVADGQIALWNPTTGNCNLLPPADARIDDILGPTDCVYGFGYDDRKEEHVLLRLVQTMQSPIVSAVSMYRSKHGGGWRWLRRILPYSLIESGRMGVYLHGSLHWIMRRNWERNSAKVLVAFDLRTKKFVEMNQPDNRHDWPHRFVEMDQPDNWRDWPHITYDDWADRRHRPDQSGRMDLAVLGDQLCLITRDELGFVDGWIMREYGSNQPWHLQFSLRPSWSLQPIRPMAYFQDGSRVLVEVGSQTKTLHCYNLDTNEVEQFRLHGMPRENEFEQFQLDGMSRHFDEATCLSLRVDQIAEI